MFKSPAEEHATKILQGVQLLQEIDPKITLCALDKAVFCGPGLGKITPEVRKKLKALGWTWSEEQDSWEFYTGHG
jgi:hypothetical protein